MRFVRTPIIPDDEDAKVVFLAGSARVSGRTSSVNPIAAVVPSHKGKVFVFEWGDKVSSVKKLTLNICHTGVISVRSFILACEGLHEFRPGMSDQFDFEAGVFDALTEHTATLEVLEFFPLSSDRFRALDERLARFEKLARLYDPIGHLIDHERENGGMQEAKGARPDRSAAPQKGESRSRNTVWLDLQMHLPLSLEKLRVKGESHGSLTMEDMLGFIQALSDLILGDFDLGRQHSHLKSICLVAARAFSLGSSNTAAAEKLEGLCERYAIQLHGLQRNGDTEVFGTCDLCTRKYQQLGLCCHGNLIRPLRA